MKTLKSSIKLQGTGLMFNAPVEVELVPSNQKGIRFHINNSTIEADVNNVVSTEHCVIVADVLQGAKNKVALIEHFMASCAICSIDTLDVNITSQGFEMPIFDGSARVWVDKFREIGFSGDDEPQPKLNEAIFFKKDNSSIVLMPNQNKTTITYSVNYNHPDLKNRWVNLNLDGNLEEIIEARTFGYLSDLEKFQAMGYSKGVTIENTVGLKDDGGYTTSLRSEFEPAKHKILDIIGDFYLTGFNPLKIQADILVKEAGHALHTDCAKLLKQVLK